MADNAEKVKDIIEKELGVEREKLTNEASFIEDLGADSLDIVELVMEFEKEFNIDIPDEDAEKLRTVGDARGLSEQQGRRVMKRRVVVTGLGAITPVGNDVATTWRALLDGRSGAAPITQFDAIDVPGALRLRGEGLRSAAVHGAEGSEARGPLHAVRRRRRGAGDDGRRLRRRQRLRPRRAPASSSAAASAASRASRSSTTSIASAGRARSRPFFIPMFIADIAAGHRLDALQRARARTTPRSRRAPRARTRSATRSAPSSTATPTS